MLSLHRTCESMRPKQKTVEVGPSSMDEVPRLVSQTRVRPCTCSSSPRSIKKYVVPATSAKRSGKFPRSSSLPNPELLQKARQPASERTGRESCSKCSPRPKLILLRLSRQATQLWKIGNTPEYTVRKKGAGHGSPEDTRVSHRSSVQRLSFGSTQLACSVRWRNYEATLVCASTGWSRGWSARSKTLQ